MLNTLMQILEHELSQVKKNYFFFVGQTEVDTNYFIQESREGFKREDNLTNQTNIKDEMTSFHHFVRDKKFIEFGKEVIKFIDSKIKQHPYHCNEAWGFKIGPNNLTTYHEHADALWSGVLYLNNHEQTLNFPEIGKKVKPAPGKFALFSGILRHGCESNHTKESKWGISFNMYESRNY